MEGYREGWKSIWKDGKEVIIKLKRRRDGTLTCPVLLLY